MGLMQPASNGVAQEINIPPESGLLLASRQLSADKAHLVAADSNERDRSGWFAILSAHVATATSMGITADQQGPLLPDRSC